MSKQRFATRDIPRAAFCALVALLLISLGACGGEPESPKPRQLYIFNWADYFAPEAIENFEGKFGIEVVLETFDSEEEMLAGLQSQPGRYDVAIASETMVQTLSQLRLLEPLSLERIPNFSNIQERFRGLPFDPGNHFSIPYLWGTTGLAINTKYIPEGSNSWGVLWEPSYRSKMAMLNEPQEVLGAALLKLGYSLNSRDPRHLEAARQKLLEQKPLLAGYLDPVTIIEGLVSEELWAAQLYSGDAFTAAEENPSVLYVLPQEGAALWVDNLVIPIGAPHKAEAETFINYILQPEVAGATVNYLHYASPNKAADAYIDQEILQNASIYPKPEILSRLEYYQPLDEETNQGLNRIWAELLGP